MRCVYKIPPRDVFELRQAPLGAACGHNQQPADEEGGFLQRHTQRREQLHQKGLEIREGRGAAGQPGDLGLPGTRQQDARGSRKIVERVAVRAIRNAPHGIGDVLIKAGEEAEAVLPGKRQPAAAFRTGNRNAARLSSEHALAFIHPHPKAALGQFLRGAEPRDAATQNSHSLHHSDILRRRS